MNDFFRDRNLPFVYLKPPKREINSDLIEDASRDIRSTSFDLYSLITEMPVHKQRILFYKDLLFQGLSVHLGKNGNYILPGHLAARVVLISMGSLVRSFGWGPTEHSGLRG